MDSLTQFALGAGVGAAVLGRRIGPRKAAVVGGLLGTLPDLDVLFPFADPIDSFTLHRGASHSFIVQALVTPLFGEAMVRLFEGLRDRRLQTYLAVFLIFATHAALDALTIYGTRILWPVVPDPFGVGSIFIIDPLYTLPLLLAVVWALAQATWTARLGKVLAGALVFSTAYLGWGLAAQHVVVQRAGSLLAEAGVVPERLLATPTPFNTLLWKVIAIDGDRYVNLYVPLFGGGDRVTAYVHRRGTERLACLGAAEALDRLATFSRGFYRLDLVEDELRVSDLRMGMTPHYVFSFSIARRAGEGFQPMVPERRVGARSAEGDIDWLIANVTGEPAGRAAEAMGAVDLAAPAGLAAAAVPPTAC